MSLPEGRCYGKLRPPEKSFRREAEHGSLAKALSGREESLNALPGAGEEREMFPRMAGV